MNISTANIEKFMSEGRKHVSGSRSITAVFESHVKGISLSARSNNPGRDSEIHNPHPPVKIAPTVDPSDTSTTNILINLRDASETEGYGGAHDPGTSKLFEHLCQGSDVLLYEDTSRLLPMLPPTVLEEGLELAFSSSRSGWALASLYAEVKGMAPCLLLIQTLPPGRQTRSHGRLSESSSASQLQGYTSRPSESSIHSSTGPSSPDHTRKSDGGSEPVTTPGHEEDDEDTNFGDDIDRGVILGVYLPCPLAPPSTSVRGDGRAFVFRLSDGLANPAQTQLKGAKFPSAVANAQGKGGLPHSPSTPETAALNQYAVCAASYMSFGGSSKYSTNALRIDEELRWLTSGPSDTFASPPLLAPHECEPTSLGLSKPPQRRGSGTFAGGLSPTNSIRPRSRSQSSVGEAPAPAPVPPVPASVPVPSSSPTSSPVAPPSSLYDLDRRATIKQVEVWTGRRSYTTVMEARARQPKPDSP